MTKAVKTAVQTAVADLGLDGIFPAEDHYTQGLIRSDDQQMGKNDIVDWPQGERDGYVFTPVNTVVNAFHLHALAYMDLRPGQAIAGQPVDVVFIGSCTNSRISDLRLAASVLRSRHVAEGVRLMVVPGSQQVKAQAEREGLDDVFRAAGAEWREAGCSMCIAMNGDQLRPGQYAISTSNRNFEGRQGKGGRTFLASPMTAAASAISGVVTDPRTLPGIERPAVVGGGY